MDIKVSWSRWTAGCRDPVAPVSVHRAAAAPGQASAAPPSSLGPVPRQQLGNATRAAGKRFFSSSPKGKGTKQSVTVQQERRCSVLRAGRVPSRHRACCFQFLQGAPCAPDCVPRVGTPRSRRGGVPLAPKQIPSTCGAGSTAGEEWLDGRSLPQPRCLGCNGMVLPWPPGHRSRAALGAREVTPVLSVSGQLVDRFPGCRGHSLHVDPRPPLGRCFSSHQPFPIFPESEMNQNLPRRRGSRGNLIPRFKAPFADKRVISKRG